jgi:Domain of unknown function (DUF4440)
LERRKLRTACIALHCRRRSYGAKRAHAIGKDALRASCKKDFDQFREENHSFVEDIRISGSLAVARGTQEATSTPKSGGHSVHDKEKWIVVFQRQPDGGWKVLWEIYNSDLSPEISAQMDSHVAEVSSSSLSHSRFHSIFVGPDGLRAGWRVLLFLLMLGAFEIIVIVLLRRIAPSVHAWVASQSLDTATPGFMIFERG